MAYIQINVLFLIGSYGIRVIGISMSTMKKDIASVLKSILSLSLALTYGLG